MTWTEAVVHRLTLPSATEQQPGRVSTAAPSLASSWRADVPAAVVVFLVAVPLCLGIALASNAPLFSGIIAGIVGGLVVGSLSGSQLMVSGPAAGLTAIVVSAIATLGSFPAFLASVVIAGGVQLALAGLRAGIIGYYFPSSVIRGMLAAIGIILILKQVPHAVGYDSDFEGDEAFLQATGENTFSAIGHALGRIEPAAVVLSLIAVAMLVVWETTRLKKIRLLPGPLAVVIVGSIGAMLLQMLSPAFALSPEHMVGLPVLESLRDVGSLFAFPDWSALTRVDTWRFGVTIGIVASLETLLSLEATDRLDPYKREAPTDRELAAQGVGNMVSGLVGGLPLTGVIVRSSANVAAGAQTKLSAITHGALLLVAVLSVPTLLNTIPLAALAAILIYTGFKLAHPKLFKHMWAQGKTQFVPFAVTVAAILLSDLLIGIAIGLTVGLLFIVYDHLHFPCYSVVSPPGSVLTRIRLHETVPFLGKASLARMLDRLSPGSRLELDGSACKRIDHDVLEYISDFRATAALKGIDFRPVGLALPPVSPSH